VVLGQFTSARPCATKLNRPPSPIAQAIAGQLEAAASGDDPVIDLDVYRRLVLGVELTSPETFERWMRAWFDLMTSGYLISPSQADESQPHA